MLRNPEGAVSCIYINDKDIVDDPELFLGFESGAIGMFKLRISS